MKKDDLDWAIGLSAELAEAPRWNLEVWNQFVSSTGNEPVKRCALVALHSEQRAGFIAGTWLAGEPYAELETLAVGPNYRLQGIGGSLVRAYIAWAAANSAGVRLEVRASNQAAVNLYQACGFSPSGTRRAYYAAPVEDALLFHSPL